MNTISYLKEVYGYATPIFLKDIRIGRKSKTAIRKDLSRAVERGEIIREKNGVYWFKEDTDIPREVSFEQIIELKFINDDHGLSGYDLDIFGYYTGLTFLNHIGITQQVPAVRTIATNNTSCTRVYVANGYSAIIKKGVTQINRANYKALQFFDAIKSLNIDEIIKNKDLLKKYILNNLTKDDFGGYIRHYPSSTMKKIVETGLINAFR